MSVAGSMGSAPFLRTPGSRLSDPLLELIGISIAKCLVQPLAVIETLDTLRDGIAGLDLIPKLPMPHQFILEVNEVA